MGETVRLGRIGGVAVGCNWTVVVSVALIASVLATAQFPAQLPDRPPWVHAAAGLGTALLFLGSLAIHELAHAAAAKRQGIDVHGVTLWPFGGTSRLAEDPRDPAADARVAAVGPLVSLGQAGGLWLLTLMAATAGAPETVTAVLAWAAVITVLLAAFNLAPAAPLDGGRVLRAIVWRRTGDRQRATHIAARAGQAFGALLMCGGLLAFVFLPGLGGLWAALIGGLVALAANAEAAEAGNPGLLDGLTVGDVMTPRPLTVPADIDVEAFLDRYVLRTPHSAFPVVVGGRPVGLVTLGRARQVAPDDRGLTQVADIACPIDELPLASRRDPAAGLLASMAACRDGRALVVETGCLVGMVSARDVMRHLDLFDSEDAALTDDSTRLTQGNGARGNGARGGAPDELGQHVGTGSPAPSAGSSRDAGATTGATSGEAGDGATNGGPGRGATDGGVPSGRPGRRALR